MCVGRGRDVCVCVHVGEEKGVVSSYKTQTHEREESESSTYEVSRTHMLNLASLPGP